MRQNIDIINFVALAEQVITVAMAEEEILENISIFGYNKKRLEEGIRGSYSLNHFFNF